jgi:DNA-binding MarR family transcriptional regulator
MHGSVMPDDPTLESAKDREMDEVARGMAKTKAFVDDYLPALLGQAWYLVSTEFHEIVEQHGLSVLEWRVLSTLASHGSMAISELAQTTVSKQPTVTRLVLRLEAQGHIERTTSLDDRRFTLVRVTRSGRRLVSGLMEKAEQHEREVLKPLDPHKVAVLKELLHELIARHTRTGGRTAS